MGNTIFNEICDLVEKKVEGHFWDFKMEWYIDKSADLIHDILCLVNSTHHGNKYIIIGVQNDGTVVGVDNIQRMTQAQVIDAVRKAKFSPSFPSLAVIPIEYKEKTLDIIVIYDTNNIPIVLTEDYRHREKTIKKGIVYTRNNDQNSPVDTGANYWETEAVWKKHFGLDTNIIDKCKALLRDKENWSDKIFGEHPIYHKVFPEFQIICCEDRADYSSWASPLPYFYIRPEYSIEAFAILYHQTSIYNNEYLNCDGGRVIIPWVRYEGIMLNDKLIHYLYFIKDEIDYLLFNLASHFYPESVKDLNFNPIIVFEKLDEKQCFEKYLFNNAKAFFEIEHNYAVKIAIAHESGDKIRQIRMSEDVWRAKVLFEKWKNETSQKEV